MQQPLPSHQKPPGALPHTSNKDRKGRPGSWLATAIPMVCHGSRAAPRSHHRQEAWEGAAFVVPYLKQTSTPLINQLCKSEGLSTGLS